MQWANSMVAGGQVLRLGNNTLTGALPAEWLALVFSSSGVDLSTNSLSGPFPAAWWNATGVPNGTNQSITSFGAL